MDARGSEAQTWSISLPWRVSSPKRRCARRLRPGACWLSLGVARPRSRDRMGGEFRADHTDARLGRWRDRAARCDTRYAVRTGSERWHRLAIVGGTTAGADDREVI